jgi:hypothetical protein
MSERALVEVGDGLYLKADADKIATWVELISTLLLFDFSKAEDLKMATRSLGAKAQAQYHQLELHDGTAQLGLADLDGFLDGYPDPTPLTFVVVTGEVLFTCIDGPNAGAVVLCEALDAMHDAMQGKEVI